MVVNATSSQFRSETYQQNLELYFWNQSLDGLTNVQSVVLVSVSNIYYHQFFKGPLQILHFMTSCSDKNNCTIKIASWNLIEKKALQRTDQPSECHCMIVWIMGSVCVLMFTKWCGWQSVWSSFYVVSVAHGIQFGMILVQYIIL